MYAGDLYAHPNLSSSMIPSYEVAHDSIVVAREEVIRSKSLFNKPSSLCSQLTRNYYISGKNNITDTTINEAHDDCVDVNVVVARKVNNSDLQSHSNVNWVPKRVLIKTSEQQVESVAWSHSQPSICHLEPRHQAELSDVRLSKVITPGLDSIDFGACSSSLQSDPSLSSINAPPWCLVKNELGGNTGIGSCTPDDKEFNIRFPTILSEHDDEEDNSKSESSLRRFTNNLSTSTQEVDTTLGTSKDICVEVRRFTLPIKLGNAQRTLSNLEKESKFSTLGGFPCLQEGCSSILRTRTALRKHAKVHAPRSFHCEQCGRQFAERTKLKRHFITHSGDRPYKCVFDGCAKSFSMESNLKSHMKTHTGEKSHRCSLCAHAFSHPYNLKVHILRRHKDSGFDK